MRILNSLKVPKNVKGSRGPFRLFNIHPVAKYQKIEGVLLKISKKSLTNPKEGAGKSHSVQGRSLWMRSKSSTEYF